MRKIAIICFLIFACLATVSVQAAPTFQVCMSSNGVLAAKTRCSKREVRLSRSNLGNYGLVGPAGAAGPTGAAGSTGADGAPGASGAAGEDGQLRIFGDGSAGDLYITQPQDWSGSDSRPHNNYQFHDLTIEAGQTLRVPSGTVIRCSGTFTNYGYIVVTTAVMGGGAGLAAGPSGATGLYDMATADPGEGVSLRAAASGEFGSISQSRWQGRGGVGLGTEIASALVLNPGVKGGGGGAGTVHHPSCGGVGGGTITILAKEAANFVYGSSVHAMGADAGTGGGGGGGGIIIVASQTSIAGNSSFRVNGGNGADAYNGSTIVVGAGGGGGGGIIHLISPSIDTGSMEYDLSPGNAGDTSGINFSGVLHIQGGGGGGACAGNGGYGSTVNSNGTFAAAAAGNVGLLIIDSIDPTALF